MKRRDFLLAGSLPFVPGVSFSQANLKAGRPYAGTELNLLSVVAPQFSAHEARLPQFEALTGIKVKYQYVPFANTREKLTAELVAQSAQYDVLSVMDVWAPSLYNLFEPLNPWITEKRIDMNRYAAAHLRASRDGLGAGPNYLGIPIRGHVQLLFYRKDLFDKAGLKPPTTWDEMVSHGKKIQAANPDVSGVAMYYGKTGGQNLMIWFNYLWGRGGELIDRNNQPAFASQAAIDATQEYVDVYLKHKVCPTGSITFNEADAVNSMAQGKSAMLPVWWWRYAGLVDAKTSTLKPEQVGFASLPSMAGQEATTYTNSWFYGINKSSKKKDAAAEYLAWLGDPSVERGVLLDRSLNEVVAVQTANLLDAEVNSRFNNMHRAGAQGLRGARGVPLFAQWPQVSDLLESTMTDIVSGKVTVKAGLDEAASRTRRLMRG